MKAATEMELAFIDLAELCTPGSPEWLATMVEASEVIGKAKRR